MSSISILGIYVADLAFFGKSIPIPGETLIGDNYVIGPGGKGSNQAVAAAKAGAKTFFISKIAITLIPPVLLDLLHQQLHQIFQDTFLLTIPLHLLENKLRSQ